ncbi:TetR/AcrR family transcriptional regulator [Gordonia metallireducens]|uniref:TetR/AcrR family transcriptional regulator n=1 Tax=Gordonia metallireducens TaxID=2897779 RepID=UPI001E4270EE|nr:TetR/AcrR family transcriptional regulator [Gordonia metallireducens]
MSDAAPVGRREKNKQQTRDRLLTAARELLGTRGTDATVEEIAERAEVSRATFFNYFPSKDDLVGALYVELMGLFSRVVDSMLRQPLSTYDRVVGVFIDFAQTSEADPDYMRVVTGEIERIYSASENPERSHLFTAQVRRLIDAGLEQGDVRTDHPVEFLAQMVAAIYVSTMRYWRLDPDLKIIETFERAGRYAAESLMPR